MLKGENKTTENKQEDEVKESNGQNMWWFLLS